MRSPRLQLTIALLLVTGQAGCAPTYKTLVLEDDVPALARLKQAAAEWPTLTTRVPTRIGDEPAVCVAIHETGTQAANRVVILIHGCLADHRTWRFLVGDLGADHRVIMLDLPGCGASDRLDLRTLGTGGYSPDVLAERLLQALETYLAGRKEQLPITLVGHSLGGSVVIRMMANPDLRAGHDRVLRRVDRLVLLAPADSQIVNAAASLVRIAETTPIEIFLADISGTLLEEISKATRGSVDDPKRALRESADQVYEILRDHDTRLALQEMLARAVPRKDGQPDWGTIDGLITDYANVDAPCLIVWGAHDETLSVADGYRLAAQIPGAELHIVDNCKHSIQLERPELCAKLIRGFSRKTAWAPLVEERDRPRLTLLPPRSR